MTAPTKEATLTIRLSARTKTALIARAKRLNVAAKRTGGAVTLTSMTRAAVERLLEEGVPT